MFAMFVFLLLAYRTHQLRVHMAHIGHPILGDSLYPIPEHILRTIQQQPTQSQTQSQTPLPIQSAQRSNEVDTVVVSVSNKTTTNPTDCSGPPHSTAPASAAAAAARTVETTTRRVQSAYPRLCLHALHLTFTHPVSKEIMTLSALP